MTFAEYQQEAIKTFKGSDNEIDDINYLALGLSGELGELCNIYKKQYHNQNIREKYVDESGDVMWYFAVIYWYFISHGLSDDKSRINNSICNGWNSRTPYNFKEKTKAVTRFSWIARTLMYNILSINDHICNILNAVEVNYSKEKLSDIDVLEIEGCLSTLAYILAQTISCIGYDHKITLEEIYDYNIKKLRDRHGDSYNPNHYRKETNLITEETNR